MSRLGPAIAWIMNNIEILSIITDCNFQWLSEIHWDATLLLLSVISCRILSWSNHWFAMRKNSSGSTGSTEVFKLKVSDSSSVCLITSLIFEESLPNVDEATQRSIHGIIGILNLIAGPYLLVITSKLRVGDVHGQPIYKIQTTDMIPYARSLSHLNEYQVGIRVKSGDRSICFFPSWNTTQNIYRWSSWSCARKHSIFLTHMISRIRFNACKPRRRNFLRFPSLNVLINGLSGIVIYSVN